MNKSSGTIHLYAVIGLVLLTCGLVGEVAGFSTPESIVAAGNVYVSDITYDPGSFFTGDTGTFTAYVTNSNSNRSVVVNHVTFGDENIRLISRPYDTSANIGPLQKQSFIFSITTDDLDGIYYPTFSLSFRDADSLYYRAMIQVDNTPLELTLLDKPDVFTQGKKRTLYMQVANPRKSDVKNMILEASGTGVTATPSRTFVGDLGSGAKIPVNFTITPDQPTTLHLTLNYDNGDNPHTVNMELPITFGVDKKQANPVMSNVLVKNEAGIYHITGDVNNAGLETANTVMVTALAPAFPQDPYKTYVVGALKPDDFGSFEVTFSAADAESIPLRLSYKDTDGNVYTSLQDVKISSAGVSSTASAGSPVIPIIAAIVILAVFIGGWMVYLKKFKK